MTGKQRVEHVLNRQPVDQCPASESFWSETGRVWLEKGYLQEDENFIDHFQLDLRGGGWLVSLADLDFEEVVVEETEETVVKIDGNGATLRRHKVHDTTPEHVDFAVKERTAWEEKIKPHLLTVDDRRLNTENYRNAKALAEEHGQYFHWSGVAPFEQMHPVCGHEYMLMGMVTDPDWVRDMALTYADFTLMHLEKLFADEGKPDGLFFYEDMGFKGKPFMSPAMYAEIIQPAHAKLFDYAHQIGCKVIVHSCGYVEPLVPGLIEAGMDCLQAMEVKAGMDVVKLAEQFGDRIAFFGGMDAREIISNDPDRIEAELQRRLPPLLEMGVGYILHSDHSIPPDVEYDSLAYFIRRGREITAGKNWPRPVGS